jgi:hypothetical protein
MFNELSETRLNDSMIRRPVSPKRLRRLTPRASLQPFLTISFRSKSEEIAYEG